MLQNISISRDAVAVPQADLDWSLDGQSWVFLARSQRIATAQAFSSESVPITGTGVSTPRWSPDGASIAYLRADGIYLMDRDGHHQRRIFAATGVSGLDW
jgi:hypothetical protein